MKSESNNSFQFKKAPLCFALIFALFTSCFATHAPSDDEAVKLLKEYFSFYNEEGIDAKIVKRGEFIVSCKCYPIEFQITNSRNKNDKMTFFFYNNGSGTVEIKKFNIAVKTSR